MVSCHPTLQSLSWGSPHACSQEDWLTAMDAGLAAIQRAVDCASADISLTAGSTKGHVIVQLAPPDMPEDWQLRQIRADRYGLAHVGAALA
jgi:hypothetical protein